VSTPCLDLAARGFAIIPGFLAPELVATLREELLALDREGQLRPAGIGRATEYVQRADVRGDLISWLESGACSEAQATAMAALEALRVELNRTAFLGLRELECHLALYPPGGHYDKHLDAFRGRSERRVSIVVYLNADWRAGDGGQLRLYEAGSDGLACDIDPIGGTLACFLSEEIWHEVLPTTRTRLSLTGWFRS